MYLPIYMYNILYDKKKYVIFLFLIKINIIIISTSKKVITFFNFYNPK